MNTKMRFQSMYYAYKFMNVLPLLNFIATITVFTFQLTILYPWQHTLSKQIKELNEKIDKYTNTLVTPPENVSGVTEEQ